MRFSCVMFLVAPRTHILKLRFRMASYTIISIFASCPHAIARVVPFGERGKLLNRRIVINRRIYLAANLAGAGLDTLMRKYSVIKLVNKCYEERCF